MLIATAATAVGGIKALKAAGSKAQLVTLSNNASGGFVASLGDSARGVIVTQVSSQSSGFLLVKEATELARAKGISDTSPAMLKALPPPRCWWKPWQAGRAATEPVHPVGPGGLRCTPTSGLDIKLQPDQPRLDFTDLSIISHDGNSGAEAQRPRSIVGVKTRSLVS